MADEPVLVVAVAPADAASAVATAAASARAPPPSRRDREHETAGLLTPAVDELEGAAAATAAAAPAGAATAVAAPELAGKLAGLGLMLLSGLAFSSMALFVSILGHRGVPSLQSAVARYWISAALTVAALAVTRRGKLREWDTWLGAPEHRWLLLQRGLWGAGGMSSYFYSLSQLPLADATVLSFTNVPLTALLAALLLREPYTWLDGCTALVCMGGVVLIAQPAALFGGGAGGGELPVFAVLVCLFGAVTSSLAYVTVRQLGGAHSLVILLYFSVVGALLTPVLLGALQRPVALGGLDEVALIAAVGVSGFLGQAALNRGIQLAPAGPAMVMRYTDIVFALVYQSFLFRQPVSGVKLGGAAMIMSCIVGVLAQARRKRAAVAAAAAAALPASSATAAAAAAALGGGSDDARVVGPDDEEAAAAAVGGEVAARARAATAESFTVDEKDTPR